MCVCVGGGGGWNGVGGWKRGGDEVWSLLQTRIGYNFKPPVVR